MFCQFYSYKNNELVALTRTNLMALNHDVKMLMGMRFGK